MAVTRQHLATDSVAFEIDAKIVRAETIRAIRGFVLQSEQSASSLPHRPRKISVYSVIRIMRDLELTLAAISGSLAEGVEYVTSSKAPPSVTADVPPKDT